MYYYISVIINICITVAVLLCFGYQSIFFLVRYLKKSLPEDTDEKKRYAFFIAARNEECVIGDLIDSIHAQDYPLDLIDIFVVADNCTDNTAGVVREKGVRCFERNDTLHIGKGYALSFLVDNLEKEGFYDKYDAFFVFDADNILRTNYVTEMNKVFCAGYKVVTSLRNSKNLDASWISFGCGLWFIHESELLNKGRMEFGTSCMVSGTGYLVSTDIIREAGGWNFFLLTEDVQFSAYCISNDIKIGYCKTAEFFDEQPTSFKVSWAQRRRWIKGYFQVFVRYGWKLVKKTFKECSLTAFDMFMQYLPAMFITSGAAVIGFAMMIIGLAGASDAATAFTVVGGFFGTTYFGMVALGLHTICYQRGTGRIHCSIRKRVKYVLLFPVYVFSNFPIAISALFTRVEWKPIKHISHIDAEVLEKKGKLPDDRHLL